MKTTQILLIEDNSGDIRLIQELLKEDGRFAFEVHSVKRLAEGMEYQKKNKADIILLDLSLPDSQGFDTFAKLNTSAPNTPIVILTGLDDDALATQAVQAGAQDYLIKGQVNEEILTRTIRYSIQRKQAEKQLNESEQRNANIIEGTNVGTWEWNVQTGETVFNQRWVEIVGYSLEELAPISIKTWTDLAHPDDLKLSEELLEKHFQGSLDLYDCEIRMRHKNGTWVWVQDRGRVITRTADGKPLMMFGTHADITERKQGENLHEAIFEIMQASVTTEDLHHFLSGVHKSISKIILAENFFVALYNKDKAWFEEIYSVDKYDPPTQPQKMEKSISAYVFKTGKPLLLTQKLFNQLAFRGEVELVGKNSPSWLGVPLIISNEILGVMVVQDYEKDNRYTERDLKFMVSIAGEVAHVVERKQSEVKLRYQASLLEKVNDVIISTDENSKITSWNRAAELLFGWKAEEAIGHISSELLKTEYPYTSREEVVAIVEREGKWRGEITRVRKDGVRIPLEMSSSVFTDEKGKTTDYVNVDRDISERKQAEDAFRKENELRNIITQTSPVGITMVDKDGVIQYANPRAEQILGLIKDKLAKMHYNAPQFQITAINGDPFPDEQLPFVRVRSTLKPVNDIQHAIIYPNKKRILLSINATPLLDEKGLFNGMVASLEDITERKQAEVNYQMLFQSMLDGFALHEIILNKQGKPVDYLFLSANPAFERITGLKEADIKGRTVLEVLPATEKTWIENYGKVALTGEPMFFENYARELDKHFEVTVFRPAPMQFATIFVDITERKKAEEVLRESEQRYSSIFNTVSDVLFLLAVEPHDHFRFESVNPHFLTITGLKREQVEGKLIQEVLPPTAHALVLGKYKQAIQENRTIQWEEVSVYPTGTLYGDVSVSPAWNSAGVCTHLIGLVHDITERKKAEEEISKRVSQLATARAIGKTLTETLELVQIYERLYQAAMRMLPDSETMFISFFDREKAEFRCVFGMGDGERFDTSKLPPAPLEPPGIGTQSEAVHTRLPLIVNNLQERLKKVSLVVDVGETGEKPQSGLYVPMLVKDEVIGVVIAQSQKINRYTPDDAEMLSLVANTAAIAIQNAQLFTQTEQRLQQISAMHTIDATISNSYDLELTLNILLEIATSQLGVHAADILVLNKNTQFLECANRRGFRTSALQYTNLSMGQGLAGQVALERKMMVIQDLAEVSINTINSPELAAEGFVTYIGTPLVAKGEIIGVLEIFNKEKLEPTQEWLNFLETLAGQAALGIDNSMLFNNLQRSNLELSMAYDATIQGWSNALDLRDKETQDHSRRVIEMTMQLASRMEINEQDIIHIRRGVLLHDIGKMGISDGILHKPGPLTEEEWVSMRRHPQLAYDLLAPIQYLHKALEIPYCHHEKWDGTGYPRGLKGEQIPLSARIFAVVDVWDALISDRPYRKAWTKKKALSYIKENSGTHFDARVVKELLELEPIKNEKRK